MTSSLHPPSKAAQRRAVLSAWLALASGCAGTAGIQATELGDDVPLADGPGDGATPDPRHGCRAASECPGAPDPCLAATCEGGVCGWETEPDFLPCDDDDQCTAGTYCSGGACGGGRTVTCEDKNPCTVNACDPIIGCTHPAEPAGAICQDGDPCSEAEACDGAGGCVGTPRAACTCATDGDCVAHDDGDQCTGTLLCDQGACRLDPESVVSCPDPGVCRQAVCDPWTGSCAVELAPAGSVCDDGNPCTTKDACQDGLCQGSPGPCACDDDAECEVTQPPGYDLCQGPPRCLAGACGPDKAESVVCLGQGPLGGCAVSACDPATGLCGIILVAEGSACDPEGPCADLGACSLGACVPPADPCDDLDPCTADQCDPLKACQHTPVSGPCDDGDPCTVQDACQGGACKAVPAACSDGDACTEDGCDAALGGCFAEARVEGAPCEDGDPCTAAGTCLGGACLGQAPLVCPAPGPCEIAFCDPATGACAVAPVGDGKPCEDEDACTQTGLCAGATCKVLPKACNDGDPCTTDGCDPSQGCTHGPAPDQQPCETGDPCLLGGMCLAGQCSGGSWIVCENGPCDVRECDSATGACAVTSMLDDGTPCGKDQPCQTAGTCSAGSCLGQGPVLCDDANACTVDSCDPVQEVCSFAPKKCTATGQDPCLEPSCEQSQGCTMLASTWCDGGDLVLAAAFECKGGLDGWLWEGSGFTLDLEPAPPGAWDDNCSLGTSGLESAKVQSPPFELDSPSVVTIRFMEWVSVDPDDAKDQRWVGVLTGAGKLLGAEPLPKEPATWKAWGPREVAIAVPAGGGARVVLGFNAGPAGAGGLGWFIDRLVVVSQTGM